MNGSAFTGRSVVEPGGLGETVRAVSLPVLTGLLVRAIPVVTTNFPLNDGGLFFAMTRDLQNANFLLPATTTYNGLGIPFAYPPLGFYVAGLLSSAFGVGLIDVFRFLPLIVSTLTIPVVYLLAREILATRFQALLATWAFALLPRSFDWLIAGGGVTRSLGLLVALLAILEGIRFYRTSRRRDGIGMAVFAGLTALSHPEAALFVVFSMLLAFFAYGRTRRVFRDSVLLAGVAAVVAAPWWLTVISIHGVGPLISGSQTSADPGATLQPLLTFTFTDEPYAAFLAVVGLVGFLHQVATRRYLLPAWVVLVLVGDPRGASTSVMIPLAMLIAIGVDEVLLARLRDLRRRELEDPFWPSSVLRDRFGRLVLGAGLVVGIIGGVRAPIGAVSPLHALPAPNRAAMAWIAANAPPSARFLVVTGSRWFLDATSEWFPVLASRESLATLQGYEWLGKGAWDAQERRNVELQLCAYQAQACLASWTQAANASDAWIYVPVQTIDTASPTGDCCAGFRASLETEPSLTIAYDGPGGTVFKPRS